MIPSLRSVGQSEATNDTKYGHQELNKKLGKFMHEIILNSIEGS
jgi:hypothetical protein